MESPSKTPRPLNEPVLSYLPNSSERSRLEEELKKCKAASQEIPAIIGGKKIFTGRTFDVCSPHDHKLKLAVCHTVSSNDVTVAIENSLSVAKAWSEMDYRSRAAIFLRAAQKISEGYRYKLNASTMLGQSKTPHQAEIDAACELADFFRFNPFFLEELHKIQPESTDQTSNHLEYRALEGFVFAIAPFNFTSISGNLATAPALMGNTVLWKPSNTAVLSSYHIYQLLEECGLPPGVIQFLPGSGQEVGPAVLKHPRLAGVHFTGSSQTFQGIWSTIGANISKYPTFPRIVGETGGKDFVFVHASADEKSVVANLVRGAFEYQGQKCSAASRAYIPKSLWKSLEKNLISEIESIRVGDPCDDRNFMGAVIDKKAFERITGVLSKAEKDPGVQFLTKPNWSSEQGYFISPTLVRVEDPKHTLMSEEIFGPVLSVYIYEDRDFEEVLKICAETSPYALTGAIFATDRRVVEQASLVLRQSAGNFYINSKPTGAVVGQQPFGGARLSGTNDKAGSIFNLIRWTSLRTVSETLHPVQDYRYPWMVPQSG